MVVNGCMPSVCPLKSLQNYELYHGTSGRPCRWAQPVMLMKLQSVDQSVPVQCEGTPCVVGKIFLPPSCKYVSLSCLVFSMSMWCVCVSIRTTLQAIYSLCLAVQRVYAVQMLMIALCCDFTKGCSYSPLSRTTQLVLVGPIARSRPISCETTSPRGLYYVSILYYRADIRTYMP